ncbi:hypothetical protein GGF46_004606 [Coemansia sp. RSA 552]|nr:hypothetical protein GGF46_004606 [Coemansia sp. RSA 552]
MAWPYIHGISETECVSSESPPTTETTFLVPADIKMGTVESLPSPAYNEFKLFDSSRTRATGGMVSSASGDSFSAKPQSSEKLRSATVCLSDCNERERQFMTNERFKSSRKLRKGPSWRPRGVEDATGDSEEGPALSGGMCSYVAEPVLQSASLPHLPSHVEHLREATVEPSLSSMQGSGYAPKRRKPAGIAGLHQKLARRLSRSGRRSIGRRRRNSLAVSQDVVDARSALLGLARPKSMPNLHLSAAAAAPVIDNASLAVGNGFSTELSKVLSWLAVDDGHRAGGEMDQRFLSSEEGSDTTGSDNGSLAESLECLLGKHLVRSEKHVETNRDWKHGDSAAATSLNSAEPSSVSLVSSSSSSSSLTLSEVESITTDTGASGSVEKERLSNTPVDDDDEGEDEGSDGASSDYDGYIYLTACQAQPEPTISAGLCHNDENTAPERVGEEVRRWWPRCVVPVQNMQYMPKLSTILLGSREEEPPAPVCGECSPSLEYPVDEALTSAPCCSNRSCRYFSGTGARQWSSESDLVSTNPRRSSEDYWSILGRCASRPTSSLALASLKDMVTASDEPTTSSTGASSDSTTIHPTATSCLALRGRNRSSSQLLQQRGCGKQKQKRVLSEPMQYILYNSYLRYYGKPNEA